MLVLPPAAVGVAAELAARAVAASGHLQLGEALRRDVHAAARPARRAPHRAALLVGWKLIGTLNPSISDRSK